MNLVRRTMFGLGALALLAGGFALRNGPVRTDAREEVRPGPREAAGGDESESLREIPSGPEKPRVEITPQGELARVGHRDREGRIPLERIETPRGTVTVQRTYGSDGRLLEEKATLDGQPVPVPKAR